MKNNQSNITSPNMWWGYKHISGITLTKRFHRQIEIDEAIESGFVAQIVNPFEATNREEASKHIVNTLYYD